MKINHILKFIFGVLITIFISSCSVIGGIFKTGMGVGVIGVIAVIALIIFLIIKSAKK